MFEAVNLENIVLKMHKSRSMGEKASIHHRIFESLFDALCAYHEAGVCIVVSGKPASPRLIANLCLEDPGSGYMPDFVLSSDGTLDEIRFDLI
ncbi:MAG: hypothetical protein IJS22_00310 [Lachnospiraceae bacterium]|nr:hypothetical protein [Lachnospiraceae bacterium]